MTGVSSKAATRLVTAPDLSIGGFAIHQTYAVVGATLPPGAIHRWCLLLIWCPVSQQSRPYHIHHAVVSSTQEPLALCATPQKCPQALLHVAVALLDHAAVQHVYAGTQHPALRGYRSRRKACVLWQPMLRRCHGYVWAVRRQYLVEHPLHASFESA